MKLQAICRLCGLYGVVLRSGDSICSLGEEGESMPAFTLWNSGQGTIVDELTLIVPVESALGEVVADGG